MHSHNYTPAQAYKRSYGEGRALAAVWAGRKSDLSPLRTLFLGWLADLRRDFRFCIRQHALMELPYAALIRWQQRRARLAGFRAGWDFYREQRTA
jgi:rhamnosyltransferase